MVATSVNQSKKLLELGINPVTSNMFWAKKGTIMHPSEDYELVLGTIPGLKKYNLESVEQKYVIPAWSLSALLDLVPEDVQLTSKGHTYQAMTLQHLEKEYYPSAIDAVYNLLCVIYGERVLK